MRAAVSAVPKQTLIKRRLLSPSVLTFDPSSIYRCPYHSKHSLPSRSRLVTSPTSPCLLKRTGNQTQCYIFDSTSILQFRNPEFHCELAPSKSTFFAVMPNSKSILKEEHQGSITVSVENQMLFSYNTKLGMTYRAMVAVASLLEESHKSADPGTFSCRICVGF